MSDKPHRLLRYFQYSHLPPHLAKVSEPFAKLAASVAYDLPGGSEVSVALRKLLEAKDAAVRAALDIPRKSAPEATP